MKQVPDPGLRIDPQRCTGCGACVAACPAGALELASGRVSVARPDACAGTAFCELACPTGAIQLPMQIL